MDKKINETTWFHSRIGKNTSGHANGDDVLEWQRYFITTQLGYGITMDAGRFNTDWEDDLGLVADDSAFVGGLTRQGFRFTKDWGMANIKLLFARDGDNAGFSDNGGPFTEAFLIAANLDFQFNEKIQAGLLGYWWISDQPHDNTVPPPAGVGAEAYIDEVVDLGLYAKFKFHPSVELKGVYYHQSQKNLPDRFAGRALDDSASAWKAILDINQDLLKFTSLQVEYANIDTNFILNNAPYDSIGNQIIPLGATLAGNNMNAVAIGDVGSDGTAKVWGVRAAQKWNDKWSSWLRYYTADWDIRINGVWGGADNFGLGIGYQLNPAVNFELAYDYISYDIGNVGALEDSDHVIRFRTLVSF
jgi:hypothetical protein